MLQYFRQDEDFFKDIERTRIETFIAIEEEIAKAGGYKQYYQLLKDENPCSF